MTKRYDKLCRSVTKRQKRDCSVVAVAIAGRVSYQKAEAALTQAGKRINGGAYDHEIRNALIFLGCEVTVVRDTHGSPFLSQPNDSRYTMSTIGKLCKRGYYVAFVRGHVAAVVNGEVEDWTDGRRHQVYMAYKVTVPKGSRS